MHPVVKSAASLAVLAALGGAHRSGVPGAPVGRAAVRPGAPGLASLCPPGTLPDARVCIPVPAWVGGGEAPRAASGSHRERTGRWAVYDHIPRRPERPRDYRRYRYPFPVLPGQDLVVSGYDLGRPDAEQRRGPGLKAVGHGGIDLAQKRGTEVRLVDLEHQVGDADVVFVGPLFGNTVVTRHSVRESGRLREYVVLHGHLEGPAPGLAKGSTVRQGSLLGFVGDSGSPGDVHLHLETRRVRRGVDIAAVAPNRIAKSAYSVVCDPRNVLPLAAR